MLNSCGWSHLSVTNYIGSKRKKRHAGKPNMPFHCPWIIHALRLLLRARAYCFPFPIIPPSIMSSSIIMPGPIMPPSIIIPRLLIP